MYICFCYFCDAFGQGNDYGMDGGALNVVVTHIATVAELQIQINGNVMSKTRTQGVRERGQLKMGKVRFLNCD